MKQTNSINKIRSDYAAILKPFKLSNLKHLDENKFLPDRPYLQLNSSNWNQIKSIAVTSLSKVLDRQILEEKLKKYQKSQQLFSQKIYKEIVEISKNTIIMNDTDEFYNNGNQFDDARFDFKESSKSLSKYEDQVLFFFGENTIYTEEKFVQEIQ